MRVERAKNTCHRTTREVDKRPSLPDGMVVTRKSLESTEEFPPYVKYSKILHVIVGYICGGLYLGQSCKVGGEKSQPVVLAANPRVVYRTHSLTTPTWTLSMSILVLHNTLKASFQEIPPFSDHRQAWAPP